jgi:lantibiotic modifying enzyme
VQKQLSNLIHRAEARGGFYLFPDKNLFNPGFFQGLSGIGYALLRLAKPDRYPNVLLWQ